MILTVRLMCSVRMSKPRASGDDPSWAVWEAGVRQ